MKVIYFGHFHEGTGWSRAAADYALALDSVGVDVVIRSIRVNGNVQLTGRLKELEDKSVEGVTHIIYHVLPHFWEKKGGCKNIGIVIAEGPNIEFTPYEKVVNLMDSLWSTRTISEVDTNYVPHPFNLDRLELGHQNKIYDENHYNFYFIGEGIHRKDIPTIIQAYYHAFDSRDNVRLTIKSSVPNSSGEEAIRKLGEVCRIAKTNMGRHDFEYLYPEVVFVCDKISEDDLYSFHRYGDCFVTATKGEAWGYPCFDAMAYGNRVIAPESEPFKSYLNGYDGWLPVDSWREPIFGAENFVTHLHTSRQTWDKVNWGNLSTVMRNAYTLGEGEFKSNARLFSYTEIGKRMEKLLN